ncbi:putative dioxygenase domain-containing protein [Phytophthora infestans]|uniref:Putative dioxygenase domain-containing protein n=1 Tax=Phytophthora infestans TaxID=4787 RepID=A0A833TAI8_PHYIN|nr:putative dioxygenase domain-containing protein [Phytophthora infestans]
MPYSGGAVLPNGTYSGGRISHVGQLFFDQSLIRDVQTTAVYIDNSNPVTTNEDDSIALESTGNDFDPFVRYAKLGSSIEDGLLSWISVGVDITNDNSVSAAGTYRGSGGETTAAGGTTSNSGFSSALEPANISAGPSASADAGNDASTIKQFGALVSGALMLLHLLLM